MPWRAITIYGRVVFMEKLLVELSVYPSANGYKKGFCDTSSNGNGARHIVGMEGSKILACFRYVRSLSCEQVRKSFVAMR